MVLRCAWGTCNSDERYPERMQGYRFILFPKPKRDLEKCLRWIKACGRPHDQLNVSRINKHKAVCSKHFVGENGPTEQYPCPIQADGSAMKASRQKRTREYPAKSNKRKQKLIFTDSEHQDLEQDQPSTAIREYSVDDLCKGSQTDESWVSPIDLLALTVECHELKSAVTIKDEKIKSLEASIQELKDENGNLKYQLAERGRFGVDSVKTREDKIKGLFKYYTAITYVRFLALFTFLIPPHFSLDYEKGRTDLKKLTQEDCLFLVLVRLRHNFGLKDIAMRFELSVQSASSLFNTWIDHLYFKFGQLSIWPHRDAIIEKMPKEFRNDFPTTLVIIDGTEFKTQSPCALGLQSQLYSDYKSNTTLKALIGCDPSGSVIFISELFTGSISDKAITEQSGFYDLLIQLKDSGFIKDGDAVMADKGFTIGKELKKLGFNLNIPPFSASGAQMSAADTKQTLIIAKHRVHIERLIAKVKTFQILSNVIPTNLFQSINKIWSVCSFLTLFQDTFVTDKTN